MGKVPFEPDCTATRLTGARQRGAEEVVVGVEDTVGGDDGVGVPVRDCELLGAPVLQDVGVELGDRVAELLGVSVKEAVAVELDERVCEALAVSERVGELLGDRKSVV